MRSRRPAIGTFYWAIRGVLEDGEAKFNLSQLRHTFTTLCRAAGTVVTPDAGGVNPSLVAKVLGHSESIANKQYAGAGEVPMMVLPPYAQALYDLSK